MTTTIGAIESAPVSRTLDDVIQSRKCGWYMSTDQEASESFVAYVDVSANVCRCVFFIQGCDEVFCTWEGDPDDSFRGVPVTPIYSADITVSPKL